MKNKYLIFFLFPTILLMFLLISCSSMKQIESFNPSKPIRIDGLKEDWDDKSFYIEDTNMSLMISNDDQFLYIYAATTEKMPLLTRGLTIWFDSTGGKDNYFGIHFPLGMQGKQPQFNILPSETEGKYPNDNPPQNRDKMMSNPLLDMDKFEILGAEKKDKRTFYLKDDIPIKIAILDNQFFISYEARIPLYPTENFKYAINPGKNKTISLGFEFGEIESRKTRSGNRSFGEPGAGGPPPDGGGFGNPGTPPDGGGFGRPGGGGRTGRGGTRGNQSPPDSPESQNSDVEDFWIKINLK